jgi:hypothetical protein
MFSVTMPPEIPRLADDILDDSVVVAVGARKLATAIARRVYPEPCPRVEGGVPRTVRSVAVGCA